MEIRPTPAGLAQLTKARDGRLVPVDDDASGVARGLAEIDPHIRLRYSEPGEYFVVYFKPDDFDEGEGDLIFTAQELDQRIVSHMQGVYWRCQQPGYSYADELEAEEARVKKERDHEFTEEMGETYERLGHALRKDTMRNQSKVFVPKALDA